MTSDIAMQLIAILEKTVSPGEFPHCYKRVYIDPKNMDFSSIGGRDARYMLRRVAIGARICLVARGLRTHVHPRTYSKGNLAARLYVFAMLALLQLRMYEPPAT